MRVDSDSNRAGAQKFHAARSGDRGADVVRLVDLALRCAQDLGMP